ncbi:MAG: hypothetical protein IJ811_04200 [Clostridia bacterium]|nr:hypothetical protein [Clostridia bacterium]
MKDVKYFYLFQIYGKVLTPLQAEMTEMYYSFDMSLSEIAEIKGVSRQSVEGTLKKSREELDRLEQKLGNYALTLRLKRFAEDLPEDYKTRLTEILEE